MSDEIPAAALASYLNGAIHVDALAAILEGAAWDAPDPLGSTALRLIYEFGNGDWMERELRAQLHRLIEPRPAGFVFGIGVTDIEFGSEPTGVTIRRSPVALDQTSEQAPPSQSGPHYGIGIGETTPVVVR